MTIALCVRIGRPLECLGALTRGFLLQARETASHILKITLPEFLGAGDNSTIIAIYLNLYGFAISASYLSRHNQVWILNDTFILGTKNIYYSFMIVSSCWLLASFTCQYMQG